MMRSTQNIVKEKSFAFAMRIVKVYNFLKEDKKEFILSKQLLRSGTSIGAMVREAINAETSKDFIHKLSVAQKECDETCYWLGLLHESTYLGGEEPEAIHSEAIQLLKIVRSIITSKQKLELNNS
jgi:four helix bundle protein